MQTQIQDSSDPNTVIAYIDDLDNAPGDDAAEAAGSAEARPVLVRIILQVSGFGSFTAGPFSTAKGDTGGFIAPRVIRTSATPGPGHRFSHWTLNGQFAGEQSRITVLPKPGLTIHAVFTRVPSDTGREERSTVDGWDLNGPGDEDRSVAPSGAKRVKFSNQRKSAFSVDMYLDGSQLGSLGPGTSHTVSCSSSAKAAVKSGASAKSGQRASGAFTYD